MAKKTPASRRGTRLSIIARSAALAEIFRQSGGKQSFTIATLTDAAIQKYPHLFTQRPHASTMTRAVEALIDGSTPIRRHAVASAASPIGGSAKQLAWTYMPGSPVLESLEKLSDVQEKIDTLIALAVAAESVSPLAGLRIHDVLVQLQEVIAKDPSLARHVRSAKNTIAKYGVRTSAKKKNRGTLLENKRRDILRTLDQCTTQNLRMKILHRHQWGQRREEEYVVEPHALYERGDSAFLIARTVTPREGDLKQFKVDRISKAVNLRQPNQFEYDSEGALTGRRWPAGLVDVPPFPLDKVIGDTIHNYLPRPGEQPVCDIVIEGRSTVANWIVEELLNPRQKTKRITLEDGTPGIRVMIEKAYLNDITPRILGLGSHVKVIAPQILVDRVRGSLENAVTQYTAAAMADAAEGGKPPAPG